MSIVRRPSFLSFTTSCSKEGLSPNWIKHSKQLVVLNTVHHSGYWQTISNDDIIFNDVKSVCSGWGSWNISLEYGKLLRQNNLSVRNPNRLHLFIKSFSTDCLQVPSLMVLSICCLFFYMETLHKQIFFLFQDSGLETK